MPLPQYFDSATLTVNGRQFRLTSIRIQDYQLNMDRDEVRGMRGVRGHTAVRENERITLEAEVSELQEPLRNGNVTASCPVGAIGATGATGAADLAGYLPIAVAEVLEQAAALAIERDIDRATVSVIAPTLEGDDALRNRLINAITRHGRLQPQPPHSLSDHVVATGADLDRIAATYGIERDLAAHWLPRQGVQEELKPEKMETPSALEMIMGEEMDAL